MKDQGQDLLLLPAQHGQCCETLNPKLQTLDELHK